MWVNRKDYEQLWLDGRLRAAEDDSEDDARDRAEAQEPAESGTIRARGRE